ncbi:hypothetical protein ISALK_03195 [Isachenkonia alkalipeptolytica]|uniref:Uncharacterized protein n=1 Tax=Isachenkonia alkalipeptolytica TaxID=2565777 RepID=A0AA43XIR1_9CLOT|nr:hypothetical protein [Isachenkonia alkalipeptolytica]
MYKAFCCAILLKNIKAYIISLCYRRETIYVFLMLVFLLLVFLLLLLLLFLLLLTVWNGWQIDVYCLLKEV